MHTRRLIFIILGLSSLAFLAPGCGKITLGTDAGSGDGFCGDGVVEAPEACDDGGESAECDRDCTPVECGDGVVNTIAGEQCDGPIENGVCDGCFAACSPGFETCSEGQEACSVDIVRDPANCGACGNECPDGTCIGGVCAGQGGKFVFLSSWVGYPQFGGVFGADQICQELAASAGLPGEFMAWLSDDNSWPSQRFQITDEPYMLVGGRIVASSGQAIFDGQLDSPIDLTEFGEPAEPVDTGMDCLGDPPYCTVTFTGTDPAGRVLQGANCGNWSGAPGFTFVGGDSTVASPAWTYQSQDFSCDRAARLYCFQQ